MRIQPECFDTENNVRESLTMRLKVKGDFSLKHQARKPLRGLQCEEVNKYRREGKAKRKCEKGRVSHVEF